MTNGRLPQAVIDIEQSIQFDSIESVYVFEENGELVFSKLGDENGIDLTPEEVQACFRKIVTHNHPFDEDLISVSFSPADIQLAAEQEVIEIRAVTPDTTYSMRPPPEGWNAQYWQEVLRPAAIRQSFLVERQFQVEIPSGQLTVQEAQCQYFHRVWSGVAPELGLIYECISEQLPQAPQQEAELDSITSQEKRNFRQENADDSKSQRLERPSAPLLTGVDKLSDSDFLALYQAVVHYLDAEPPRAPSVADRQAVQQEIDTLVTQINSAWREQEQQIRIVGAMQKNPFRMWNKKYEQVIEQVQATMKVIGQLIAQKQQKETFLKQWAEQDKSHQSWENAPRTAQMRSHSEIFNRTLMQSASRQEQERQAALRQGQQRQQRERGLSF